MSQETTAVKLIKMTQSHAIVGGYGVVFGGQDLEGDTFTKETDFWFDRVGRSQIILYQHGMDSGIKSAVLGQAVKVESNDIGVWLEAQIELSNEYSEAILQLVESGNLGWSSGSVPHLVHRDAKSITSWPIVEFSLTPTPAEPRTIGVERIKNLAVSNPNLEALLPEAKAVHDATEEESEAVEVEQDGNEITVTVNLNVSQGEPTTDDTEDNLMSDEIEVQEAAPVAAPAVDMDAMKSMFESVVNPLVSRIEKLEATPVAPEPMGAPNIKRVTKKGFANDEVETFKHWVRTGDEVAAKAALQEGTDAEGGYLVPEDMLASIVEKRDEMSILRMAGVQTFTTNRDRYDIPVENAKMTNFVITAEEAAYNQNEPTFNEVGVTIYKFTKEVRFSEELESDEGVGLIPYLNRAFGRAWGLTENQYGLVGTGSGQPQGVFVGGTAALTADSATAIAASEIPELYYKLGQQYRDQAVWVSSGSTEGALRALQGDDWLFVNSPQGAVSGAFWANKPLYTSESVANIATGNKTLVVGNFDYYGLVTRSNLTIQRNPYLYQATGQIALFAKVRMGGAVLQAEAFQYLTQA